jgi:Anticodon binding domain
MPSEKYVEAVLKASHERMHTLKDIYEAGSYFFTEPNYSHPTVITYRDNFYQKNSRQLMGNQAAVKMSTHQIDRSDSGDRK